MSTCLKCKDKELAIKPYEGEIADLSPETNERFVGNCLRVEHGGFQWFVGQFIGENSPRITFCRLKGSSLAQYGPIDAKTFEMAEVEGKTVLRFKNDAGSWEVTL